LHLSNSITDSVTATSMAISEQQNPEGGVPPFKPRVT